MNSSSVKYDTDPVHFLNCGVFELAVFYTSSVERNNFYLLVGSLRKTTVTCFGSVEAESSTQRGSKLSFIKIIVIRHIECVTF